MLKQLLAERSREAAKECSPRRKPWVSCGGYNQAPKGRKTSSHSRADYFRPCDWSKTFRWISVCVLCALSFLALAEAQTPADALALEQQGKFSEAAQAWRAVSARDPNDAVAFASLGLDLARQQKYDEAA